VLGQLEAMIGRIGVYRDRDKYLRQSYALMKTMEKLVYEILDVSRMDRPDFSPCMERIDLTMLVKQVIEDSSYFADEKEIRIHEQLAGELEVFADAKLLKQAIHNILLNAIQYSPLGAEIRVSVAHEKSSLSLSIENTGIHIDESLLDKVFEPFYRIEKSRSRQTGGSGLGLYIVKRTLEVQKIPYRFENTRDGVCFTMCLQWAQEG
jgi:two-component system, OmpR family, sensor histidine kinase VanS